MLDSFFPMDLGMDGSEEAKEMMIPPSVFQNKQSFFGMAPSIPSQSAIQVQVAQSHMQAARQLQKYYKDVAAYWESMIQTHQSRKRKLEFPTNMTKRQCTTKERPEGNILYPRNLNCDGDWAISKLYGLRDYTCVSTHTRPGYWYAVRVNSTNKFPVRAPKELVEGYPKLSGGRIWGFIKLEETDISDEGLCNLGLKVLSDARNKVSKTGRITQKVMNIVDRKVLTESILVTPQVYGFHYTQCVGGMCMDRISRLENPQVSMFDDVNEIFEHAMKSKTEIVQ